MSGSTEKSPRPFLFLATAGGAAFLACWALGRAAPGGFLLAGAFLFFSMACSRIEKLRSLTYTMLILCLVCVAMFYPRPLQGWGGFKYVTLIPVLLQVIMFGVGSQMSLKEFEGVVRMPKAVAIGIVCHYTIMPLVGFTLSRLVAFDGAGIAAAMGLTDGGAVDPARVTALSGAISAGIVLIGCSPSGLASNVMCFLARGNLALSVTIAACSTLLAPLMTPVLMKVLAGTLVEVRVLDMMHDVIRMLIYPIMAGLLFNAVATMKPRRQLVREGALFLGMIVFLQISTGFPRGLDAAQILRGTLLTVGLIHVLAPLCGLLVRFITKGGEAVVKRAMGFFSMVAVCAILSVITAANRDSLMKIGMVMILLMLVHNLAGYFVGYWSSRLLGLDERSSRTVAFEVGQQNGGLANGLAASLPLDAPVKALMGIAPAVFGAMQNITGSALATWWRGVPIRDEAGKKEAAAE
ncbi:MAG: bile acid:sodium symporter family protein [Opitutaceae bacterium]|jgi:BASS family bile acid:Na+ symporter|nr:bile acid:sodium symporter family protein [Opitutaceae bacterium]